MADPTDKFFRNIPGPFYTDTTCTDCDLCRELVPDVFRRDDDEGMTYVWRQPVDADEIRRAEEARAACPTDSIGNDG